MSRAFAFEGRRHCFLAFSAHQELPVLGGACGGFFSFSYRSSHPGMLGMTALGRVGGLDQPVESAALRLGASDGLRLVSLGQGSAHPS